MRFFVVCTLIDENASLHFSQTFFRIVCSFCMLSEFAEVFERKLWRVQVCKMQPRTFKSESVLSILDKSWQWSLSFWTQIEFGLSVVCTLTDKYTRYHNCQNLLWTHSAAPRESTTFWPLWWRLSFSIRIQTTLNHIGFANLNIPNSN